MNFGFPCFKVSLNNSSSTSLALIVDLTEIQSSSPNMILIVRPHLDDCTVLLLKTFLFLMALCT